MNFIYTYFDLKFFMSNSYHFNILLNVSMYLLKSLYGSGDFFINDNASSNFGIDRTNINPINFETNIAYKFL